MAMSYRIIWFLIGFVIVILSISLASTAHAGLLYDVVPQEQLGAQMGWMGFVKFEKILILI